MRKIDKVLSPALGRDEVLKKARAQSILKRWEEVVGPEMARRSWPDGYTNGTVWVAVTGSAWASELRLIRDQILNRLHMLGGEPGMFQDIRFGHRPLPARDEPVAEAGLAIEPEEVAQLSIREIAERRLKKMRAE
jgi:predicted nucleic acid-binding Zn ribbon protein